MSCAPPRFACDVMLGRTARWLRMLGFDTDYDNRAGDEQLRDLCLREKRVLLTKDVALHESMPEGSSRLVAAVRTREQLQEIVSALGLARFALPSRCSRCNGELDAVEKDRVAGLVPPYVFRTQERFQRCRLCRRLYWRGTHMSRIVRFLENVRGPAPRRPG